MKTNKFNSRVLLKVLPFNGSEDRNGKRPVLLHILAGKAVNKVILSGTVAEKSGFKLNRSYFTEIREMEPDVEYGRQFKWLPIHEYRATLHYHIFKDLGEPVLFDPNKE